MSEMLRCAINDDGSVCLRGVRFHRDEVGPLMEFLREATARADQTTRTEQAGYLLQALVANGCRYVSLFSNPARCSMTVITNSEVDIQRVRDTLDNEAVNNGWEYDTTGLGQGDKWDVPVTEGVVLHLSPVTDDA